MNTEVRRITVGGVRVDIVRKDIKNLHLGVYPPNGRVRVATPLRVSDDAVRLAVVGKLGWIKRQRARFDEQPRQSAREMEHGESHYFLGRRYRLRVVAHDGPPDVQIRNGASIELRMRAGASPEQREQALQRWYRRQLSTLLPVMVEKWRAKLGVDLDEWRLRRMKTKWGTCNVAASRIWLNSELAKKPIACVEYLVVHELAHLIERRHNDRFVSILDEHLPNWRRRRDELNATPLAHERWEC
jgi:predicted metal-dependent hydrolase